MAEEKKVNLIIKKLKISDPESLVKVNSFSYWDKIMSHPENDVEILLNDTELLITHHGFPDSIVEDGTDNPVCAGPESEKFFISREEVKVYYQGMRQFLESQTARWKTNYPDVKTIYVVSCFNSWVDDYVLDGLIFKFIGSYKQPVMLSPDKKGTAIECCYTEDYVGSMTHNFVLEDCKLLCNVLWSGRNHANATLVARVEAYHFTMNNYYDYKARNNIVEETFLNAEE